MKRGFGWVLAGILALGVGAAWPGGARAAAEGDAFPAMSLADVDRETTVDVGGLFQGKVGALAFMQTSCAACRKELEALRDLRAKYPALAVVVVSVDSGSPARVQRYKEHFGFDFPFLHDPEFQTPALFGFSFTPGLVLVNKAGSIGLVKGGYRPGDEVELERRIAELSSQ